MAEHSWGVVVNGDLGSDAFVSNLLKEYRTIICVDGAANRLMKLNVIPSTIIGDLDSITPQALEYYENKNVLFLRYSPCKDKTDTDIAVGYCVDQGAKTIDLIGGIGSRVDHSLANISLLYWYRSQGIAVRLINEYNTMYLLEPGTWVIPEEKNHYLSFLPYGGPVFGITLKDVNYPLLSFDLPLGSSRCISNEFAGDATLSFDKGHLLTMIVRKGL